MADDNPGGTPPPPPPAGQAGVRARPSRQQLVAIAVAIALVIVGTGIAVSQILRSGPLALHSAARTPTPRPHASSLTPQIVFTSDQSVILSGSSTTYQFVAHVETSTHTVVPEALLWVSSSPAVVSVDSAGLATANANIGSATIFVSAPGAQEQAAQVAIAAPAPNTLLVPSADVISISGNTVRLKKDPQVAEIAIGDILVSGNRAGLLVKVLSVSSSGPTITVTTAQATLLQAFPVISIRAESAPTTVSFVYGSDGNVTVTGAGAYPAESVVGRSISPIRIVDSMTGATPSASPQAASPSPPTPSVSPSAPPAHPKLITCDRNASGSVSVTLSGPSFSVTPTTNLIGVLTSNSRGIHFVLAVQARIPVIVSTGSLLVSAAGTADVTCKLNIDPLDLPTPLFFGPIEVHGVVTPSANVVLTAKADGSVQFNGPSVSDTAAIYDGIEYTSSGGWTSIHNNAQTGVRVDPFTSTFAASLTADVTPDARVDFGVSFQLGPFNVAQANLVFGDATGLLHFEIASPFDPKMAGYRGPAWSAGFDLSAGPEIALSGALPTALSWLGLQPPTAEWTLLDFKFPLGSSPHITLAIAGSTSSGGSGTITATVPSGYEGDTATFVLYPKAGGRAIDVVPSTTVNGTVATTTYTAPSGGLAPYQVAVLLAAAPFGSVLPYASTTNPPASPVGVGTAPPSSSTSASWTSPVTIDQNGGGLTSVSCPGARFCAAVDGAGNALTYDGNTWSQPQSIDPNGGGLYSVSCPTIAFCVAGDGNGSVWTYDGKTWSGPQNVAPSGFDVRSISCPSAIFCLAVDRNGEAFSYDGRAWKQFSTFSDSTTRADSGLVAVAVSCSDAGHCLEVDGGGNASQYSGGSWGQPLGVDLNGGGLDVVSCPSVTFCVTPDFGGDVVVLSGTGWASPLSIDAFGVGYGSRFNGSDAVLPPAMLIDCASASFCVAVDGGGNAVTYDGGHWSAPVPIDSGSLTGISCPTTSFCMAVDANGAALSLPS